MVDFVTSTMETVYNIYQPLWLHGEQMENHFIALHLKG